jgi:hypothetical protein
MNRLTPAELPQFLRRFRFPGGRVRRVRLAHRTEKDTVVELRLVVRESIRDLGTEPRRVRLVLRLEGVEEFRFQMRPAQPRVKITDARIGYLNGLYYVNLDAWGLDPGETPKLHDFRASEAYAAGRELLWEEVGGGGSGEEKGRQGEEET